MHHRAELFKALQADANFTDVRFDPRTGGLRVTHVLHIFHPKRGHYEDEVADALVKNGDLIILGKEKERPGKTPLSGVKHADGQFNDFSCEIASVASINQNGVLRALKHCRSKGAEVAIIHFVQAGAYTEHIMQRAIARYNGISAHRFREIVVVADGTVYKISHP